MAGPDRKRVAKIIGRLGSDQAGEVTAAAAALVEALAPHGGIRWLAEAVTHGRPPDEAREGILQRLFRARIDNAVRNRHQLASGDLAVLAAAQQAGERITSAAMAEVLAIEARIR